MLYLNVPFEDRNKAKELGARFDIKQKLWFVNDRKRYPLFLPWIAAEPGIYFNYIYEILTDFIYIAVGQQVCWKCRRPSDVIGFGYDRFFPIDPKEYYSRNVMLIEHPPQFEVSYQTIDVHIDNHQELFMGRLNRPFAKYLRDDFRFYRSFSKRQKSYSYINHCQHCGVPLNDFHLFNKQAPPFRISDEIHAEHIVLHKIPLPFDLCVFPHGKSNMDFMILDYAFIQEWSMDDAKRMFGAV